MTGGDAQRPNHDLRPEERRHPVIHQESLSPASARLFFWSAAQFESLSVLIGHTLHHHRQRP
jgi:hypothetical protein